MLICVSRDMLALGGALGPCVDSVYNLQLGVGQRRS